VLFYRVYPSLASAGPGQPGHPLYLHKPQGASRLDNPGEYDAWYFAAESSGAVGETFGDLSVWVPGMFAFPLVPGSRKALGTYSIPDNTPILDLDDAKNLLDRGLRPTQVVERKRSVTQSWALDIFRERKANGDRKWNGVRWWSFQRPQWRIYGLWEMTPEFVQAEELDLDHPAVVDAAKELGRRRSP
jgi:hypothetical protein